MKRWRGGVRRTAIDGHLGLCQSIQTTPPAGVPATKSWSLLTDERSVESIEEILLKLARLASSLQNTMQTSGLVPRSELQHTTERKSSRTADCSAWAPVGDMSPFSSACVRALASPLSASSIFTSPASARLASSSVVSCSSACTSSTAFRDSSIVLREYASRLRESSNKWAITEPTN